MTFNQDVLYRHPEKNTFLVATEKKAEPVANVMQLTKRFGSEEVLKHVSVEFHPGNIYGIIGRNGSGKTVLLKCICGFLYPDIGEVHVFGKIIGKDIDFAPHTGILIERPGFLPNETARKNLRWLAQLEAGITKERVDAVLRLVGLNPDDKKPVGKYSMGMQQKVGIAQALLSKPKLLILDEPMNALDKKSVEDTRRLLLELKQEGTTILLASHIAQDLDELCDMVYELNQGILIQKR